MTNIPASHPAVEAGAQQLSDYENDGRQYRPIQLHYEAAHGVLEAALPHLTADDLRDTPAGQALITEGRGWTPTTERDRRALTIINDPTVPETTRHILAKGIHLLHKIEGMTKK